jgi:hypothetical protein
MVRWMPSVRDFINGAIASTHQQSRIILGLDATAIVLAISEELIATDALVLVLVRLLGRHGRKAKAVERVTEKV